MSAGGGGLLRVAVDRPVTVMVTAILVVLFGALSIADLPIQLTPDVSVPTLTVRTRWPGSSPTEVETEILEPQEDALKDVPGLVKMTSDARADQAYLTLEFAVGTDIDDALVRVSNRLTQVGGYPEAVDEPSVQTADSTGPPIAVIAVRSPRGESVDAYRTWMEDRILPDLQRIDGVGDVRLVGGRDRVLIVDFDPAALASRGVRVAQLVSRVRSELSDVSGGDVTLGRHRLLVRTMAVDATPEELDDIVIAAGPDGTPIHVRDVGSASLTLREPAGVAMSDDRPSLIMMVDREAGTNVLEVTRRIRSTVERLDRDIFVPEGLRIEVISDQVDYIEGALATVEQNLVVGAILAALVLLVFLRSVGASAIISVSIPVCVFGTLLGMTLLGRTINVVSLAGITFAIGMVVDNSIVSLENIDNWRARVSDPKEAAFQGVREVWGAILASTATTAAVFVPVIAWEGEVGQILRDIAVAVSFAIITSLWVSVWVIPSLATRLRTKTADEQRETMASRAGAAVGRLARRVSESIPMSVITVVSAVGLSVAAAAALLPPLEYLPSGNRNLVFGMLTPPPGTSVDELDRVARTVQTRIARENGHDGVPEIGRSFFVGSPDRLFAGATAEDPDQVRELLAWLREVQSSMPGFSSFTTQASLFGRHGGGRSIEVNLVGRDLHELMGVGSQLMGEIREALPGAQVRPDPSLDPGAPELRAYPRRRQAAGLGMTTDELGLTVDALVDGAIIGELGPEGEPQLDVLVRARRGDREVADPESLASAPVVTPSGEEVPLAVLADLREELGPTVIRRLERRRGLTLVVAPPEEIPLESAIRTLRERVLDPMTREGALPPGVDVTVTGSAGDLDVAKSGFLGVLLIAVLISYLLMAALFEDFLAPVVVMVSVPLAAAGGMAALRLVDVLIAPQPLDLVTAVGFLILIGTVVNNAILVVDGAIARLREGDALGEAVGEAVRGRVRPILMTTATSLAGLLPMVVVPGAGSELYRGVGAIVLGGLALSTVLTLVVVPSFFALVWRARGVLVRKPARTAEPVASAAE